MVEEYGRGFFLVTSNSRRGMKHLVDFEPELDDRGEVDPHGEPYRCSCESFNLRLDRPCRHCVEVFEYLLPIFQHLAHWQPKQKDNPPKPARKAREYKIKL